MGVGKNFAPSMHMLAMICLRGDLWTPPEHETCWKGRPSRGMYTQSEIWVLT